MNPRFLRRALFLPINKAHVNRLIYTNYSTGGGWCSKEVVGPYGVRVWKYMRRWGVFSSFIRYEVGDESKIRFWYDLWCEDQPLKGVFFFFF
jgi:hypothetical protein